MTYTIKREVYYSEFVDKLFILTPWFTTIEENESVNMKLCEDHNNVPFVYGAFYQCGWLIENEHGVVVGVSLSAVDNFKYIGEL